MLLYSDVLPGTVFHVAHDDTEGTPILKIFFKVSQSKVTGQPPHHQVHVGTQLKHVDRLQMVAMLLKCFDQKVDVCQADDWEQVDAPVRASLILQCISGNVHCNSKWIRLTTETKLLC